LSEKEHEWWGGAEGEGEKNWEKRETYEGTPLAISRFLSKNSIGHEKVK